MAKCYLTKIIPLVGGKNVSHGPHKTIAVHSLSRCAILRGLEQNCQNERKKESKSLDLFESNLKIWTPFSASVFFPSSVLWGDRACVETGHALSLRGGFVMTTDI